MIHIHQQLLRLSGALACMLPFVLVSPCVLGGMCFLGVGQCYVHPCVVVCARATVRCGCGVVDVQRRRCTTQPPSLWVLPLFCQPVVSLGTGALCT
jgi:hypothetical protein